MPIPAIAIMAMMAAASAAANAAGQRKVDKARAAAMRESRERNDRISRESSESAKNTTDLLIGTKDKQDAAAKERAAAVIAARDDKNPINDKTNEEVANSVRAPNKSTSLIEEDRNVQKTRTKKFADQQAQAAANMASFGDVMVGNNLGVGRNQQNLNQAATSMQSWNQNVLPMQLEAGNQAGNQWKALADAIQVASMIYGGVGLVNGAAGAGAKAAGSLAGGVPAGTGTVLSPAASAANMPSFIQGWAPQAAQQARPFYEIPFNKMIGPYQ